MILLGDTNVGKTCIFDRITRNQFNDTTLPTMQNAFAQKVVSVQKFLDSKGQSMQNIEEMKSQSLKNRRPSRGENTFALTVSDSSGSSPDQVGESAADTY